VEAGDVPEEKQESTEREGRWKILGEETAAKGDKLQDPFSLLHEGREGAAKKEILPPAGKEETPPVAQVHPAMGAKPDVKPDVKPDAKPGKVSPPAWVLKGILSGAEGRLAIVSNGKETRSVAVGEHFGECVVEDIGEDFLTFSGDGGGGQLQLRVF
ncbi:MAG: hypothetical protein II687_04845, partial [Selenomonadaceae bacterium]|nr:hypothetical protein [Selenomonadaceae bacterium]